MNVLQFIWEQLLYTPLINALIYFYNEVANQNLGWAVVYLTVALRVVLLPFSIIGERNRAKFQALSHEITAIEKSFKNDPIVKKEMVRKFLHEHKISPWAKSVVFWFQVLLFVVLYRVFLGGVKGKISVDMLYDGVDYPVVINTNFYGYDVSHAYWVWGAVVAVVLFVEIYLDQRKRSDIEKKDQWFGILFPVFIGAVLMILPMVKSLFVLTSIAFSAIIRLFGNVFGGKEDHGHGAPAAHGGGHDAKPVDNHGSTSKQQHH